MGNASNKKELRSQLRQIVKEILPELTSDELMKILQHRIDLKITKLEETVKENLDNMSKRHADTMDYLIRNVKYSGAPTPEGQSTSSSSKE